MDELFLGEEEQDDDGSDDHGGSSHLEVDWGAAGLGAERLKSDGEGPGFLLLEVEEGGEEVVPGSHEAEQRDYGEGWFGEGEDDFLEDSPLRAAIDFGGFGEFHGNASIELAQEENVEGSGEPCRNPEGTECTNPSEIFEEAEKGHHENREWHHHGGDGDGKSEVAAGPLEACE